MGGHDRRALGPPDDGGGLVDGAREGLLHQNREAAIDGEAGERVVGESGRGDDHGVGPERVEQGRRVAVEGEPGEGTEVAVEEVRRGDANDLQAAHLASRA